MTANLPVTEGERGLLSALLNAWYEGGGAWAPEDQENYRSLRRKLDALARRPEGSA
jgi:hypothetical protein